MSQENVERYVRAIDAWNRGALDEWLEGTVTPGWELVTGGAFAGLAPIYRGRDGAREMWDALRGPWDDQGLLVAIDRIEDLGDTVLALFTMRGRGGSSGVPVAIKWAHVVTYSSGDEHIRSYTTWDDALKAVGWRSRRCPRTSISCARSTRPGSAAISAKLDGRARTSSIRSLEAPNRVAGPESAP